MTAIQCQHFVKDRLKAPASADFSSLGESATAAGGNKYVVRAYVDALNSFGAKLRNDYVCTVEYTGAADDDGGTWRLIELTMNEK
jgi:hypothetical protein